MESPLLRELKGLLVSSPEESVRLQKESPLLRELEGLLGILEEPFAPDDPKRSLLGVPAPKGARRAPSLLSRGVSKAP